MTPCSVSLTKNLNASNTRSVPSHMYLDLPDVQARAEHVGVAGADGGVEAVGGEHQVVVPAEFLDVRRHGAEAQVDVELGAAALQQSQQFLAAHRGEALAADGVLLAPEVDVDVGPAGEALGHVLGDHGVGVADSAEGLVAEDDAEAERVACGVAFPDGDLVVRVQLLHEGGEVQSARAAADDCDFHVVPLQAILGCVAERGGVSGQLLAQLEVLELAAGVAGQAVDEAGPAAGTCTGRSVCLTKSWISLRFAASTDDALAQHDERADNAAALRVGPADHRVFQHVRVLVDRGFDLGAADVVAGGHDHVVAAGLVVEVAVGIAAEGVAGDVPAVDDVGVLALVVEVAAAGGADDGEAADARRAEFLPVGVQDRGPVAGHRLARGAGADVVPCARR